MRHTPLPIGTIRAISTMACLEKKRVLSVFEILDDRLISSVRRDVWFLFYKNHYSL